MRRLRVVLGLVLAAGLLVLAPPGAEASPAQCSGNWTMQTAQPLRYPLLFPPVAGANFAMNLGGLCAPVHTGAAAGFVSGWCGEAQGAGAMDGHHNFNFVWLGNVMTFTGAVVGTLHVTPLPGESCLVGADAFFLTGTLTLV